MVAAASQVKDATSRNPGFGDGRVMTVIADADDFLVRLPNIAAGKPTSYT